MIKRYNDFVNDKTNEEFTMAQPLAAPAPKQAPSPSSPDVLPGTTPKPGEAPSIPSPIRRERTSPTPAPAKAESELPEEEGDEYIGRTMMMELANKLGETIESDGSINYNGKKINFYSETEMFHVDNKKFKSADEVISYLDNSNLAPVKDEKLSDIDEDEFEKGDISFESKSYRKSRIKRK